VFNVAPMCALLVCSDWRFSWIAS